MELVTAVLGDHGQRPKDDYGTSFPFLTFVLFHLHPCNCYLFQCHKKVCLEGLLMNIDFLTTFLASGSHFVHQNSVGCVYYTA